MAQEPQIALYQRTPLRGEIFDFLLPSNITFTGREFTLQAEPLFFARNSLTQKTLAYTWRVGDTETSGPDSARGLMTFRQEGAGVGSAVVEVEAQNTAVDQLVQAASAIIQLVFSGATAL